MMKNLENLKKIYFVGIKGVAMTSLALCSQDLRIAIEGSDTKEIFVTDEILKQRKIKYFTDFNPKHIKKDIDLVITTGAHGGLTNVEVLKAKSLGIPIMTQGEALGYFAKGKQTIGVCGVGGKTTTSSMLCKIFSDAKLNPSYAIGVGKIFPLGVAGRYSKKGKYFICEADEYANSPGTDITAKFLFLAPKYLVVTNIEHDHPDIYPDIKEVKKSYLKLFQKVEDDGLIVAFGDNKNIRDVIKNLNKNILTYGFEKQNDYVIENYFESINDQKATIISKNGQKIEILLTISGKYNMLNALASYIVSINCGISNKRVLKSLIEFKGTRRRFERIGKMNNGAVIIDDYAHHPKEIKSLLESIKRRYQGKKIIAVFQPHTYSRTKSLFEEFSKCFSNADYVVLMDIYASAREKSDKDITSQKLAQSIGDNQKNVIYTGGHNKTIEWLRNNTDKNSLILTIGAGDIFHLHKKLLN